MNLITVEVLCPSTSRNYDFKMPVKMSVGDIKRQMIEDIRSFEGLPELFSRETEIHLYSENGCISDDSLPENAGVKNGDKLMII